jgi:hypothetical protein
MNSKIQSGRDEIYDTDMTFPPYQCNTKGRDLCVRTGYLAHTSECVTL